MFRNLARMDIFMAFPRILYIGILWRIISFHLDMCRYADIVPVSAAIFFFFESRNRTSVVAGIVEFPDSVEVITEGSFFFLRFLSISVVCMVRMRTHSSISEILWIFYQRIIKSFHSYPPVIGFYKKRMPHNLYGTYYAIYPLDHAASFYLVHYCNTLRLT